jgi:hypothetical protein
MLPRDLIVRDVRRLIERHFLERASGQAKVEYASSSDPEKTAVLKAFLQDKAAGSKQWAIALLDLL